MRVLALVGALLLPVLLSCGTSHQSESSKLQDEPAQIVEFRIPANAGRTSWNSVATEVTVSIGQTLRIFNDDAAPHRLHTNGKPCPHAEVDMAPNGEGHYDCVISVAYSRAADGPLYDHNIGTAAKFYLRVLPARIP